MAAPINLFRNFGDCPVVSQKPDHKEHFSHISCCPQRSIFTLFSQFLTGYIQLQCCKDKCLVNGDIWVEKKECPSGPINQETSMSGLLCKLGLFLCGQELKIFKGRNR